MSKQSSLLSVTLPGTWELMSRTDVDEAGEVREEPTLGSDPVAWLIYDRAGHFAVQFMKRDRCASELVQALTAGANNTRAIGGYDAYFGTYAVDDNAGMVTQRLVGALSTEGVGLEVTRGMAVEGNRLTITLRTNAITGEAVTRTLLWKRIG